MNAWLTLITTLPTENATARQRAWRALKASGAAVLRDGVYLLPTSPDCRATLDAIAAEVTEAGGTAWLLPVAEPDGGNFAALFDRSNEYAGLQDESIRLLGALAEATASDTQRQARKLRKAFSVLAETDFFPGPARVQTEAALHTLELAVVQVLAPDEPRPSDIAITRCDKTAFQKRLWATRQRPWVDRLASAWLIKRFVDPAARFVWLARPADCPPEAIGFDFDGATFTHVGNRVTFEVVLASFSLEQAALLRIGALVHYLDVGGVQPAEAAGVESILAGLRERLTDDDRFLEASLDLFDGLYAAFASKSSAASGGNR